MLPAFSRLLIVNRSKTKQMTSKKQFCENRHTLPVLGRAPEAGFIFLCAPFSSVPFKFLLYTCSQAFPLVFALMETKSKTAYRAVIREVKRLAPDWKPSRIMADFEGAIRKVCRAELKNRDGEPVVVLGCWFHYYKVSSPSRRLSLHEYFRFYIVV